MDFTDLEAFRSRYSDLTVTTVPAGSQDSVEEHWNNTGKHNEKPNVEIFPIPNSDDPNEAMIQQQVQPLQLYRQQLQEEEEQQQEQQLNNDAVAFSNEYQQILAKLEYTKYAQAQLQMMSTSNGSGANNYDSIGGSNIVDIYDNLLSVIAEMQSSIGPTVIGLRAPKERLLRDISHARVLVRECILMLMRNQ